MAGVCQSIVRKDGGLFNGAEERPRYARCALDARSTIEVWIVVCGTFLNPMT
jgi:hypothetical protein